MGVHHPQVGLGLRLTAQGGRFIALQRLSEILRHAQTLGIHAPQIGQGGAAGICQSKGHVRLRGKGAVG